MIVESGNALEQASKKKGTEYHFFPVSRRVALNLPFVTQDMRSPMLTMREPGHGATQIHDPSSH